MSLPEIVPPAGTPVFLESGHAQTLSSVFRDVKRGTGHSRRVRVKRSAPRNVSVSLISDADNVQAIRAWHQNTLRNGAKAFATQVARIGARGLMWWSATWVGAIIYTPLNATYWRLEGTLRLSGAGSVAGPVSTSAGAEFGATLSAQATAVFTVDAAAEFSATLGTISKAAAEFTATLSTITAPLAERRITSDGQTRVTSSGQTRLIP